MSWVTAIATVLVLWSSTAWGATLAWNASSGPDLAGYRVYQCSQLPCSQSADTATLLTTLGTTTTFNIGTPAVIQYYVVTAYNSANIESGPSNVATYTPAGTSPPPAGTSTPPPTVTLTVLGSPTSGQPWTVQAYPANVAGTVSVEYWINNTLDHMENVAPYCPFDGDDDGTHCMTRLRPFGSYTIEARVRSNGTEVVRQAITVQASATPPPIPLPIPPAIPPLTPPATSGPTVTLTVLGSPTSGQPWTVQAYPANVTGTVSVEYWINNTFDHVENVAPYCPFDGADDGTHCVTRLRSFGSYTIEARVRSNGIEVARQAMAVQASATPPATSAPKVTLTVLGSPTSGQPWTVQAYPANVAGTVSVQFLINNTVNRIEGFAPYCPFDGADNGTQCLTAMRPYGFYTIEARVLSNGAEVTRQVIVVKASSQ
ncbi:MAG: hypothetical protein LV473_11985 [Nitrospira sp.]|nr:hypothetical protein [Nitrospira sp.]